MITDEEIRAALDRVVARAPDPARIRAGFASRARAHRQRRALLVAGGALAAGPLNMSTSKRIFCFGK